MASFISIKSSAAGLAGGEFLFNVDQIILVEAATATTTTISLSTLAAAEDVVTITHGTVGTTPSVRDAINAALTANPGGVKARVNLPAGITVTGIAVA
jgi:hypothetical protein|tara:strand:+ start:381 stop:674 length:294 start_codon:yes stop_codon:yes gene_type:complete